MRKATFPSEEITEVIRSLKSRGMKPTAFLVRKELGGGDFRRIQQLIDSLQNDATNIPAEVRDAIAPLSASAITAFETAIESMWFASEKYLRKVIEAERDAKAAVEGSLSEERSAAFREIEELNTAIDNLHSEKSAMAKALDRANERVTGLEMAMAEIRGEANVLRQENERKDREMNSLNYEIARLNALLGEAAK